MVKLSPFAIPHAVPATGVYTRAYFQQFLDQKKERLSLNVRFLFDIFRVAKLSHRQIFPGR